MTGKLLGRETRVNPLRSVPSAGQNRSVNAHRYLSHVVAIAVLGVLTILASGCGVSVPTDPEGTLRASDTPLGCRAWCNALSADDAYPGTSGFNQTP